MKLLFQETEQGGLEWPYLDEVTKKWRSLTNAVMEIRSSIEFVEFLKCLRY